MRRATIVAALAVVGLAAAGAPAQDSVDEVLRRLQITDSIRVTRWDEGPGYLIEARLYPETHTLNGRGMVTWINTTRTAAQTLRFHLYWNAWRNPESTWLREQRLAGAGGLAARPDADRGSIDIRSISVVRANGEGDADRSSALRFVSPDDGNPEDRTVVELPLERPVLPGQVIALNLEWTSHVPRPFARTGVIGDYYFIAQWFPKLGVFTDDGWVSHQFHASTEFFASFGSYDVTLRVPTAWQVGATGVEISRRNDNGTTSYHYVSGEVHDFAWTTSPDFVQRRTTFEHPNLPKVDIRLLLQPEHAGQAERHLAAARAALRYFGEWFGGYPYPNLTIVDPAWASATDGMEYPTLISAGTRWLAPAAVAEPEDVVIHEIGHQFFYGVVASNEVEHAWMDEGLTTFATARVLDVMEQPSAYQENYFGGLLPWPFPGVQRRRGRDGNRFDAYRELATADSQATPSFRLLPGSGGALSYAKTALWLHTLERLVGWDMLQRILSTYYRRYAFRHPAPEDFFAVASEVAGRDLTWFFDRVYRSSAAFDYGIARFTSDAVTGTGDAGAADPGTARRYRTQVLVRRYQDGDFPVDVRVVFDDDAEVRWQWDGRERWRLFEVERPSRARTAEVDPDRVLLLDLDPDNNTASLADTGASRIAWRWAAAWLVWAQDRILTYGFFI